MKINRIILLFLFLVFLVRPDISAQEWFPDYGFLYDTSNVARVDITIDQAALDSILKHGNEESRIEYQAIFSFKRGEIASTIDSIGFRLRGNTSRYSNKKSFKVSLNTFVKGQKYHGVEKINLNGEHNDPSISRAHICWHLYRRAGVPASRSGFTELYINGEYRGLYINVEHIDEEFVKSRFGNNDGNLYKCLWPADLSYLGSSPDLYKFEHEGRRAYELKNNSSSNDYSDISNLIAILHEKDPDDFPLYLEPVFNVNTYLKNLVVEVLTGHWDAYSYNKNNYYLYHNESTDKFEFIPYDPDNTLGISWSDTDWSTRNIYNWSASWEERPLTEKILQNDIYRDRFSFFMNRFLTEDFNAANLNPKLDAIKAQIYPYVQDDLYRRYDYDYSYGDFLSSYTLAAGAHVKYGLKPYISSRTTSALSQLLVNEIAPAITIASINEPDFSEDVEISTLVEDELTVSDVIAYFSENGGDFSAVPMTNSSVDIFTATYPGINSTGYVSFYVEATDQQMKTTREPPYGSYIVNFGQVAIPSERYIPQLDISVYPNPARSSFMVEVKARKDTYLFQLYNLSGQLMLGGKSDSPKFSVQLGDDIANGLYYLKVSFQDNSSIAHPSYEKVVILR